MEKVIWSDIHHEFIRDAKGNLKIVKNIDAVYTSIDNILGTHPGERVMLPQFASRLKDLLFEPIDERLATLISDEVKRVIETWDPRVTVVGVKFAPNPDRNYVDITVQFIVRGNEEILEYTKRVGG